MSNKAKARKRKAEKAEESTYTARFEVGLFEVYDPSAPEIDGAYATPVHFHLSTTGRGIAADAPYFYPSELLCSFAAANLESVATLFADLLREFQRQFPSCPGPNWFLMTSEEDRQRMIELFVSISSSAPVHLWVGSSAKKKTSIGFSARPDDPLEPELCREDLDKLFAEIRCLVGKNLQDDASNAKNRGFESAVEWTAFVARMIQEIIENAVSDRLSSFLETQSVPPGRSRISGEKSRSEKEAVVQKYFASSFAPLEELRTYRGIVETSPYVADYFLETMSGAVVKALETSAMELLELEDQPDLSDLSKTDLCAVCKNAIPTFAGRPSHDEEVQKIKALWLSVTGPKGQVSGRCEGLLMEVNERVRDLFESRKMGTIKSLLPVSSLTRSSQNTATKSFDAPARRGRKKAGEKKKFDLSPFKTRFVSQMIMELQKEFGVAETKSWSDGKWHEHLASKSAFLRKF